MSPEEDERHAGDMVHDDTCAVERALPSMKAEKAVLVVL